MTEDESTLLASERPYRQGDLVLYDYFKHVTTLSLLILGGILTLSQTKGGAELKLPGLMIIAGVVTLGGVVSFSGAAEIARAHFHRAEPKHLDLCRKAAPVLLSVGVGMFLFMFEKALG